MCRPARGARGYYSTSSDRDLEKVWHRTNKDDSRQDLQSKKQTYRTPSYITYLRLDGLLFHISLKMIVAVECGDGLSNMLRSRIA
jgi:hypothetical protein